MSLVILRAPYVGEDVFLARDPTLLSVFQATKSGTNPAVLVTTVESGRPPGELSYGYAYYLMTGLPVGAKITLSAMTSTASGGQAYLALFDFVTFAPIVASSFVTTSTPTFMTITAVVPTGGQVAIQLIQTKIGVTATFTNTRVTLRP